MINKKTNKPINNLIFYFILTLLFFMSMNFSAKFFYFAFASLLVYLVYRINLYFDYMFIIYFTVSIIMCCFHINDGIKAMLRVFASPVVYLLGLSLIFDISKGTHKNKKELILKALFYILIAVVLGTATHFLLNFIINYGQDLGRNTIDIWTGKIASATNQASIVCITSGMTCALIVKAPKPIYRVLSIVLTIFILTYNLILAGRTIIAIYGVCFVVALFFYLQQTKNTKIFFKVALWIVAIALIGYVIYTSNFWGAKDVILESNLYERFFGDSKMGITETARKKSKLFYLTHFLEYPFGGLNMRGEVGYAHDLLLDAYDEYSIFCFIFLVLIIISSLKNLTTFVFNKNIELSYRLMVLCVYIAIYIQFFLEPIFAGLPWLYVIFCLLNGVLSAINRAKL